MLRDVPAEVGRMGLVGTWDEAQRQGSFTYLAWATEKDHLLLQVLTDRLCKVALHGVLPMMQNACLN